MGRSLSPPRQTQTLWLEQRLIASAGTASWQDPSSPGLLKNLSNALVVDSCPSHSLSPSAEQSVVCTELVGGIRRLYKVSKSHPQEWRRFKSDTKRDHLAELVSFFKSYILPEGYPESVAPAYTPYMQWRAVQYFFGGAMSVFTTKSLLHSLGVSRVGAASSAVAVNWVIKDGAGRVGKMIFARHGKKFDCHLKQLRFAGGLLMELGAGLELATMALPQYFLALACAASLAKNVGAVTATSTRTPIYKAFARQENIGDVTAKGECISNIADLLGTGLGIVISRNNPSLVTTFALLSCGYVLSSFNEVKAVRLPTLNRARFSVAAQIFLDTGQMPTLSLANEKEKIFTLPWGRGNTVELGAQVFKAYSSPQEFRGAEALFKDERYLVTYRPSKQRAYVVLKENASSEDILRGMFHAHVVLHIVRATHLDQRQHGRATDSSKTITRAVSCDDRILSAIAESCIHVDPLYATFKQEAVTQGWIMGESLLSPHDARLSTLR